MPACKGKLLDGKPCPKTAEAGKTFCRWHDPADESWRELYERLEKATPEEKTDIVLELMEDHPEHRLELPERDGHRANLSYIDLSSKTLGKRKSQSGFESPSWWRPGGGVDLYSAKLQGANLLSANLQNAHLWLANLQGANLQSANLQAAELVSADLRWAGLGGADLRGTSLAYGHLQDADLSYANMQDARLDQADLENTNLRYAKLHNVDLSVTLRLSNIYLSGVWLDRTRMRRDQLDRAIGEEQAHDYAGAKIVYLALKQNFDDLGDYEAASWAYRKERRMEKLEALEKSRVAFKPQGKDRLGYPKKRQWREAVVNFFKFLGDTFVEWLCDYGESVWRVVGWMAALLFVIGPFIFSILGGIYWGDVLTREYFTLTSPLERFLFSYPRYLLYTFDTLTAASYSDLRPGNDAVRLASGFFTAASIFLTGLLGFVAGNRIRRS